MATKTITIMEDAYELLASQKEKDESFSDTIRRTFTEKKKRKDMEEVFGAWSDDYAKDVKKTIEEGRKQSRKRAEWIEKQFTA